jgi:hypothetical protein
MSEAEHLSSFDLASTWHEVALRAIRSPREIIECPICHAKSLTASWHLVHLKGLQATVDLMCSSCNTTRNLRLTLPDGAAAFFPQSRSDEFARVVQNEIEPIAKHIRQYARIMPATVFTTNPLWEQAKWSATTFRWHPASAAPPIMGIVFEDADAGKQLFHELTEGTDHKDEFEELRVSIIEGAVPGQENRPGYSVHLCPDPEGLAARATMDDFVVDPAVLPFLGRWNRMYPIPGQPALLPKFKREFEKHQEFLLAPAVRRDDRQFWFETELGIIKTAINFRTLDQITPDDPDAAALVLPQLITPPGLHMSQIT